MHFVTRKKRFIINMAKKKVYKVSFKGVIFSGFDKDQVIENVHNITRIPKHTIARKFFSGKTVVIRHADSQEYASRLQKTFAQAGIETYISELTEAVSEEQQAVSAAVSKAIVTENSPEPGKTNQTSILPKIAIGISVIVIIATAGFFLNDSQPLETTPLKKSEDLSKGSLPKTAEGSLPKAIDGSTINDTETSPQIITQSITSLPFIMEKDNIVGLIKLTDKSELVQLPSFMNLLGITPHYFDVIKQKILSEDSIFIISKERPLYLFKTKRNSGILLNSKKKLPHSLTSYLKETINKQDHETSSNLCDKRTSDIQVVSTDTQLLLTTFSELFESLPDLQPLDALFLQTNSNEMNFSFFYRQPDTLIKKNERNKDHFLALSSNSKEIHLSLNNTFYEENIKLFNQFGILSSDQKDSSPQLLLDKNNPQLGLDKSPLLRLNKTPQPLKINLTLLIIAQMYSEKQIKHSHSSLPFQQENIININRSNPANALKPYQKELDIELQPQWQSGPFAITTNQFIFDKDLVIELLAKGQNINNLMEYSNSATLEIRSVLDKQGNNILKTNCTDKRKEIGYFRDIDGEQEAYIDDDFKTYHTITAKHQIHVSPGYNNADISKIEGKIALKIPNKIEQKTLKIENNIHYSQFKNFSILLKHITETNTLEYTVAGQIQHFISLRMYNDSGDIIETLSLSQQPLLNDTVKVYRQTLASPIETIKLFHSKDPETFSYAFEFKPDISLATMSLSGFDEPQSKAAEIQPITFTSWNFESIKGEIKTINPDWLGEKWPEDKSVQNLSSPFYISLFLQNISDSEQSIDAVLNIKSNSLPIISQNMTAVKVSLKSGNKILLDNFVSFTHDELIVNEEELKLAKPVQSPKIIQYLKSNTAFETIMTNEQLSGSITLSLPKLFKSHSTPYVSLGQVIKLDGLFVKAIQRDRHKIKFEIKGEIKNLAQLRLYNQNKELISELFEFKHLQKNKALLTLLYNDNIKSIKLVLARDSEIKHYPFVFNMEQ